MSANKNGINNCCNMHDVTQLLERFQTRAKCSTCYDRKGKSVVIGTCRPTSTEENSVSMDTGHAASSSASNNSRFDRLKQLIILMKEGQEGQIDRIIRRCDEQVEQRLVIFKTAFFKNLHQDQLNFNDDIKSYVSRHKIRREQKLKTMVNTSKKHYVAALGQQLGNDPCITLSDLDKLSPTIIANIDMELRDKQPKGKSSQEKGSSQTISLNKSFQEIQNSLISKSSYSPHVAQDPTAQIQS